MAAHAGEWRSDPPVIAVAGATGLVGELLLHLLAERGHPPERVRALATETSQGRMLRYGEHRVTVAPLGREALSGVDVLFLATPNAVSEEWGPWAARRGILAIDKSSRFRMDPNVPLVVPEVNGDVLSPSVRLVATPNCSTIPLVMVLSAIRRHRNPTRVLVSTYQAVSGTGRAAVEELRAALAAQTQGLAEPVPAVYPAPVAGNVLPHCDAFGQDGFTGEEWKLMRETQKILGSDLPVVATAVRVPVEVGHSESVAIECDGPVSAEDVRRWCQDAPGIRLFDNPAANEYPTPRRAAGTDPVWVGRIRSDPYRQDTVHLFLSCDNLRKGAALNGLDIMDAWVARRVVSA